LDLKVTHFILFLLLPVAVFAQKPVWQSVFVSQSEGGAVKCIDMIYSQHGNIYIAGYFDQQLTLADTSVWSIGGQDVFVAKMDSNFNLEWLRIIGGPGDDGGYGLAMTSTGNLVLSGFFNDSIQIDGNQYLSNGEDDVFLISITGFGQIDWIKTAGGIGMDFPGRGVTIDDDDNIYLTGYFGHNGHSPPFQLTAYFDSVKVTAVRGADIFLAKYSSSGMLVWVITAGGKYSDMGREVSVEKDKIYVTGDFTDPWIEFGSTKLYSKEGPFQDMFVACYDTAGNFLWARGAGNKNPVGGTSVAVDSAYHCFVTGTYFDDNLNFGGNYNLPTIGDFDIFIARYDSSGNFNWAKSIGGGSTDLAGYLEIDTVGNLYASGIYGYNAVFGDDTAFGLRRDVFVTKLTTTGDFQWVATAEGAGVEFIYSLLVHNEDEIYVAGSFDSPTLTFGNITVHNAGDRNFFIAKLGPDSSSTGIKDQTVSDKVKVYPNPANDGSEVTVQFTPRRFHTMVIHDLKGREIMRTEISPSASSSAVDVSGWSKGIYFIRLYGDKGKAMTPLIIN
jgi:hypothetical protein